MLIRLRDAQAGPCLYCLHEAKSGFLEIRPIYGVCAKIVLLSNKGSGQPLQMCSFARTFVAGIHKVWKYVKTQTKKLDLATLDKSAWEYK